MLLRNTGELPWAADDITRIAVIGHNAREARTQGGGSATVIPEHIVSPLEAIITALPNAQVEYSLGAVVQEGLAEIPLAQLTNPVTGQPGIVVSFLDADGAELFTEHRRSTALVWFGGDAPIAAASAVRLTTTYTPLETETVHLGFASAKPGKVWVDGQLIVDENPVTEGTDLGAAFLSPPSATASVSTVAGIPIAIVVEFALASTGHALDNALSVTVGFAPDNSDPDGLIRDAAAAAAAADVVLVVVGTNSRVESEGFDRTDLNLPGRQDELVRAVAAANPRTVVVVNAGAPVLLPWRDEVAGIVLGHFGGQEFGSAIADVVFGAAEPGGRLTTTWPAALEDVPVLDVTPKDGTLRYDEGIHIGYRAWLKSGAVPAFEFGAGTGYTTWELADAAATGSLAGDDLVVSVRASNTGSRAGKQVVQVYASRGDSSVDRPVRWLVGFAIARSAAGDSVELSVPVSARSLSHWASGWQLEAGAYTLHVGTSVLELPLAIEVTA